MVDTNNILASKPIQVMQEVGATIGSEKTSANMKRQQTSASSDREKSGSTNSEKNSSSKVSEQVIDQLNEDLNVFKTRVAFSVDDITNKTVVKIIDNTNDEVIKQVPPEYLLKVSQRITELLGLIVDEKA